MGGPGGLPPAPPKARAKQFSSVDYCALVLRSILSKRSLDCYRNQVCVVRPTAVSITRNAKEGGGSLFEDASRDSLGCMHSII